jgi:undecaprenyl-diphosphatase
MELFHSLILSVVEGITEFLPISSTGHLVLSSKILGIPQTEFVKSFEIFIQLGAILAVVVLYFETLTKNLKIWRPILIAFIPTAILGALFYKVIKSYLLGNELVTLFALLIGGIFLIVVERFQNRKVKDISLENMSTKQALLIGLSQSVSIIPGISRAAATIIGGMFLGLDRKKATEFSFLLAIPTMLAATSFDFIKSDFNFSADQLLTLTVGFIGSFITALFTIKFLVKYLQNHSLLAFGVYRIILCLLYWLIIY